MVEIKYLYEFEHQGETPAITQIKEENGERIVISTNFNTQKATEFMVTEGSDSWMNEYNEMLKQMTFTYLEHPSEVDGCPGSYTKAKGTYKGLEFTLHIDYANDIETITCPEEIKEEVQDFFWSGDFINKLLWT